MSGHIESFRAAIQSAGLIPPDMIEPDGKLHRFSSNGKRGDDAGWYSLHDDGIPAGSFGDWRSGQSQTWRADIGRALSAAEESAHRTKVDAMRREREAAEAKRKAEASVKAAATWQAATPADNHPYLTRKGIKAHGARLHNGALVIPMREGDTLHSLQFIAEGGDKRFLSGGRVRGCYYIIGTTEGATALCIAEGFATGATIHETTRYPVAVAFNAGNLEPVARQLRAKLPDLELIVCADDDAATESNPGITKAIEAARAVGGLLAIPEFGTDRDPAMKDFNDMSVKCGAEAVAQAIANAKARGGVAAPASVVNAPASDTHGWPDPLPLAVKLKPEPYPLDALPEAVRAAVNEVQSFIKAPIPMVASSALAALSLAIQAHVDVQRAEKLAGPVGLMVLILADSGERKSTCDSFFTSAIKEYEALQAEIAKPIQEDYRAAIEGWEAKRAGIKDSIRQLAKGNKPTLSAESELRKLEHDKPKAPRIPRLLYADATPEAMAYAMAKQWPSGGVVSAEGGIVFGSHGMGKDSVMRNLAMLNQLWDGNSLTIDRRTTESFTVKGARLTIALQVQEPTLREFFSRSGALARGTGFLARFLVAWPESTQGFRLFTEAPKDWPHLSAFNLRITEILNQCAVIDEDGALTPRMLSMTVDAKAAWIEYHNAIESELASGGELYDVRDVASKSADNAARLAALFQMFEGAGGAIGLEAFESASLITAWHLNESRRFFGELALPAELADAARLDSWLIDHCKRERTHLVPTREAQRLGPVRDKEKLVTALRELEELDRVRVAQEGRRKTIKVNPALVLVAS